MRWQRAAEWQRKKSGDAARGELLDVPVVPIVTMFVVAMYLTDLRPLLLPAAGAALWGLVKLRARVSQSIANVVLQSPTETYADAAPHAVLESAHTVEPATSPLASSLRLEMLDMRKPGLLPAPTASGGPAARSSARSSVSWWRGSCSVRSYPLQDSLPEATA